MKPALIAASAYFPALFALGFVFGTIRVIFVVPRIGELLATMAEVPVMLIAAYFACRWAIRRWQLLSKHPIDRLREATLNVVDESGIRTIHGRR